MGIRGLTSYITESCRECLTQYELKNTHLVIDGTNVCCKLYEKVDKQFGLMGAQYDVFHAAIKNFFESLQFCNIQPIVVFVGIQGYNKEKYIEKFYDAVENHVPGQSHALPYLNDVVFMDVLRSMKIKYVRTLREADDTILAIAKALDCPVLSQDADFYIYGTKFINLSTFDPIPCARGEGKLQQFSLSCEMYNVKKFCQRFNNLDESLLPLALVILGNKHGRAHLDSEMLEPFYERIDLEFSSEHRGFYQKRIEKTLKWLSTYSSLNEAIGALLNWVDMKDRSKVSKDIEKFICVLGVCSPTVLRALALPEGITSKIREENDRRLSIFSRGEAQKMGEVDDDWQYTEEGIIRMAPKWYIDRYVKGIICNGPLPLVMYSAAILTRVTDDLSLPPTWLVSLPIMKFTYSLMCSLRDGEENVLEMYSAIGKEVTKEEITVKTSSVNFRDMDKLELLERKRIIDDDIKSRPHRQLKRDSNLRSALSSVTEEECITAAPYFISHFKASPPGKDWRTVVHIFTQLHSCLRNSIILNSILTYPYHPVPLHRVFNGLFLYKIFEVLSKQEDVESYLCNELKYSPTIVEIFIILKNEILKMIERE